MYVSVRVFPTVRFLPEPVRPLSVPKPFPRVVESSRGAVTCERASLLRVNRSFQCFSRSTETFELATSVNGILTVEWKVLRKTRENLFRDRNSSGHMVPFIRASFRLLESSPVCSSRCWLDFSGTGEEVGQPAEETRTGKAAEENALFGMTQQATEICARFLMRMHEEERWRLKLQVA